MNRETLFWTAIKLPEPARERFIAEACPDSEIRDWLRRMVENYSEGDSFLEDPPSFDDTATTVASQATSPGDAGSPFPQIPGCEIERVLGEGGMGVVYEARQAGLERQAAVKLLKVRGALGDEELAERFRREAKSMARLDHPNIVSIYDSGQTGVGSPYFVMEFVEGEDLMQKIQRGRIVEGEAVGIAVGVCEALVLAHSKGFVHRDIKPQNILLGSGGQVKITDFGLVKIMEDPGLTHEGAVMGTPLYWAPEQSGSVPATGIDHRVDIYAVGGTLYHMLCGFVRDKQYVAPSAVCGCDKRLDAVIERCMAHDPEMRYETAEDLLADLVEIRDVRPIRTRLLANTAAVFLAVVLALPLAWSPPARHIDSIIQDAWFATRPEIALSDQLLIVAVTDECLRADRLGAWPWDRRVHASLIDALKEKGASAIAFDMFLPEKGGGRQREAAEADRLLAAAAARHGSVVFPDFLDSRTSQAEDYAGVSGNRVRVAGEVEHAANVIREAGSRPAQCHAERDDTDGKLRRLPLFLLDPTDPARPRPNLGLALALEALEGEFSWSSGGVEIDHPGGDVITIPVDELKSSLVNYPKSLGSFPAVSYSALLSGGANFDLEGKAIMVGFTATGLTHVTADKHVTVIDPLTPGVLVNSAVANSVLTGEFLREGPLWLSLFAGLLLAATLAVFFLRSKVLSGLAIAASFCAVLLAGGYWLMAGSGLVVAATPGLLVIVLAAAVLAPASRLGNRNSSNPRHGKD